MKKTLLLIVLVFSMPLAFASVQNVGELPWHQVAGFGTQCHKLRVQKNVSAERNAFKKKKGSVKELVQKAR